MEHLQHRDLKIHIQRKAFRRSTRLSVGPTGKIVISTGKSTSSAALRRFVDEQRSWLQKQLVAMEGLRAQFPKKRFLPGEIYPYLGREFRLRVVESKTTFVTFMGTEILFHRPEGFSDEACLQRLKRTYQETGSKLLTKRVHLYSHKMQLFPKDLKFRGQKSIWGSCSGDNKISLNWKLVVAPLWVVDYVVIHELAHITHKDHSKNFWTLVEQHTPNRHHARRWLKENVYLSDFLSKKSELYPES